MKSFVIDIIKDIAPKSNVRILITIKKLQNKIAIFDNAINICNSYQDSDSFFDLTKKAMKSFSDKKKAIKEKVQKLSDSLTIIQQYAIKQANEEGYLTSTAEMYTVDYYRKLGQEYGYNTNELETVKKFFSSLFLATAKLHVLGKPLNKFPRKLLYTIAFATLHHNFHQQSCNNGEWLIGLKEGEMKEVIDLLGYSSKYTE